MYKKQYKSLFFPSDIFTNVWDFIISIFILYVLIFMTFELSFTQEKYLFFVVFEYITTVIFIFDIFVNFNKVYFNEKNDFVVSRKTIACHYLKCWFWIDLIAAFPFFMLNSYIDPTVAEALRGFKLLRIMTIFKLFRLFKLIKNLGNKFKNKEKVYEIKNNFQNLVINISLVILFCHLFACIFYAVPFYFSSTNWVNTRGLARHSIIDLYLYALHWIVETVITVGYGENPLE